MPASGFSKRPARALRTLRGSASERARFPCKSPRPSLRTLRGELADVVAGTPQRSPISPLLATVALHVLDEEWSARHGGLGALVGYCDDLVVLCASGARAEEARSRPAAIVAPLGLRLNPDKTRIVCLTEGREGFDVLGFHHRTRRSRRRPGVWYLASWPSARAMRSLRAKPREATGRRNVGPPVGAVVAYLNRVRRGWGTSFAGVTRRRSFGTSTATSTSVWSGSSAPSTGRASGDGGRTESTHARASTALTRTTRARPAHA
jgi:Reverse transcriptase (RNA-dependent DNA polymerase)